MSSDLVVHHTRAEGLEEVKKYVEAAQRCVVDGLEATSEIDIRCNAEWEKYYYVKAVRGLVLLFSADFTEDCICKTGWGIPWCRGLPPGFWPADTHKETT